LVVCVVLVGAGEYAIAKSKTKQYSASSALLFNATSISDEVAGLQSSQGSVGSSSFQPTNVQLVKLGDTASQTAKALGDGYTPGRIRSSLAVGTVASTNIVKVTATATVPADAAKIANKYATLFVKAQQDSNRSYYVKALSTVESQIAGLTPAEKKGGQGLALQERAQTLATLSELPSDSVQIASHATVPTSPSSPHVFRDTVLGAVLGLVLGVIVMLLFERLDQRIRSVDDMENIYEVPLLGSVPRIDALSNMGSGREPRPVDLEPFRLLRAHLRYFSIDRPLRTVLVASAAPGSGKTTVSQNLALASAQAGSNVLLIEADLRRPALAPALGIPPRLGLSDLLIGAVDLADAVVDIPVFSEESDEGRDGALTLLTAGSATPPNPEAILDNDHMRLLLAEVRGQYDLVVIDTPPLTIVPDAFPLLTDVDGVILIVRIGHDRRDVAQRLRQTLGTGTGSLLGIVANDVKTAVSTSYSYGYSQYESASV
jgi:capsular exopolysaccharide synthesis family protein